MQATQSSTASGTGSFSGQFAALRHMSRALNLGFDAEPRRCRPVIGAARVAEGAGLAHDAGNLLGALSLYSDLLAMPGVLHEEHKEYAAELKLLSDRSWALIGRLVNRLPGEQQAAATVLPEVVKRCRGLLSKVARCGVEVRWQAESFRPVGVSVEAVERIVTNLVKNAAEAMPGDGAAGTVVVNLTGLEERGARRVVMTVTDTGCGMSSDAVRALQQSGGLSGAGGRGLGFRVVRELVALSGGGLSITSEPGVGTSVSVEWPALSGVAAEGSADFAACRSITTARGTKTVLQGAAGWIAC
jgi:signal transduction histidine kinase